MKVTTLDTIQGNLKIVINVTKTELFLVTTSVFTTFGLIVLAIANYIG